MRRPAIVAVAVAAVLGVTVVTVALVHVTSGDTAAPSPTLPTGTTVHPPAPTTTERIHPTATPIPILMYHVIAEPPAGAPYPELYVSAGDFGRQVGWLAQHGFHGVTLRDAYLHWSVGRALPSRPVVISFDDGYHSQFAAAAPILHRHGWPGVLNLEVRNLERSWGISPRQVRMLIADGWELDAHTLTHPDLRTVDAARLEREVAGSRAVLSKRFDVPVDFFCYPAGRLDDTVAAAVRSAGYLGATTTEPGFATPGDMFRLNRVRVDRSDGVAGLAAKLRGAGA